MKKLLSMLITASMIFSTVVVSVSADVVVPDGVTPMDVTPTTAAVAMSSEPTPGPAYTSVSDYNQSTYQGEPVYLRQAEVTPFTVYVNASAAGKYQISVIGARGNWNTTYSGTVTVNGTQVCSNGGTAVGLAGDGWNTMNVTTWCVADLVAGVNEIAIKTSNNNHRIAGVIVAGVGTATEAPEWVAPLQADATVGATVSFIDTCATSDLAKPLVSAGVRPDAAARNYLSTNNTSGPRMMPNALNKAIPLTFYVNAPAAGDYGLTLYMAGTSNCWRSTMKAKVNGGEEMTIPLDSWTPYNGTDAAKGWSYGYPYDMGLVTLNKGINTVTMYSTSADVIGYGIAITGKGATEGGEGGDETELPDGVTPADVSATTAVTIDADNTAVVGTKAEKLGVNTVVANSAAGFYLNAETAGTYFVKFSGTGATGYTDVPVVVNGTELMARRLFPGSTDSAFQDSENVYPVTLVEGVNVISFKEVDSNNFVRSMTVMGADSEVSVPSISTTGGKVKYTFEAEKAGSATSYVQRTAGYKHFDVFVEAEAAGTYYFTVYKQVKTQGDNKTVTVYVNDANPQVKAFNAADGTGSQYSYDTANGAKPCRFMAYTHAVALAKGLNVISVVADSNEIALDKFELRNYEVSGTTNVGSMTSGIYGAAFETTTSVASSPKVITKSVVYDSIPVGASTIDVSAWVVAATGKANPTLIVASYDSNDRLIDTKMIVSFNSAAGVLRDAKVTGLDVSGAETVKFIQLDGLTNLYNIATVSL